jgi:hypothetical protein
MSDRLPELREIVTRDYEEMRLLLSRLGEATLARKAGNGWTVGQVAGHIAGSPRGNTFVLNRLRRGKNVTVPGPLAFIINVRNWWMLRSYKRTSKQELLATLEAQHNEFFAYLNGLADADLDRGGEVLGLGTMTVYEYVKRSGEHPREHASDLRKTIGL